jgi:hypothetical protein
VANQYGKIGDGARGGPPFLAATWQLNSR